MDGVEYKHGMISGGTHHQNVFNLNLGSYELDKDIKKLTDQIRSLDDQLQAQKQRNREAAIDKARLQRELSKIDLEIETMARAIEEYKE